MVDMKSKTLLPTDMAIFSKDDVNEDDKYLLREGALIRFIIGRERLSSSQVRTVSELHFQRLPLHSEEDYKKALAKVKYLIASIKLNNHIENR